MLNQPLADDAVGGAMITGSVAYDNVSIRFTPQKSSLLLLEQGLETNRFVKVMLYPASLVIYERDEIEVVAPAYHPQFGQRLRVIELNRTGIHPADPRGFLSIVAERIDRVRTVQ